MLGKKILWFFAALALAGLQFTDCLSAMTRDQESMAFHFVVAATIA
jgi:hypothetical protein